MQKQDEAVSKQKRRELATVLEAGKIDSARIRVEGIIQGDIMCELYEILELYCELLLTRVGMMEAGTLDPGLEEAVKSIMYASPKIDLKELHAVRVLLAEKYGKEVALAAAENSDKKVSEKVIRKLRVDPPSPALVQGYLEEIAATYGVDWPKKARAEQASDEEEDGPPSGRQAEKALEDPLPADPKEANEQDELTKATPPKDFGPSSPLRVVPPSPSSENPRPHVKGTGTLNLKPTKKMQTVTENKKVQNNGPVGGDIPSVDDLAARFAALKKT
jgi:vacuolar protein sorting-associated protein IST1